MYVMFTRCMGLSSQIFLVSKWQAGERKQNESESVRESERKEGREEASSPGCPRQYPPPAWNEPVKVTGGSWGLKNTIYSSSVS